MNKITIDYYRWAGQFGPFAIKIPCGECSLTDDIIHDTLEKELQGIPVQVNQYDWLSHWYKPLFKGAWHAPIVLVNGRKISQGKALNRGLLIEAVISAHAAATPLTGNHLFGKASCPYCQKAKSLLTEKNIPYHYHDVVEDPRSLYEMLARVKPLVGAKTPITVPQIWLNGEYVGGYDALENIL
ncbi:MAG: glutaredoxin [Legionellales bacterium]|nr:glutaredoxin [Legionellales bacterium]|tara:strand:+ start:951 stop:1502 length:552 start_codon:yes stop_codon:yes gene_type:complete